MAVFLLANSGDVTLSFPAPDILINFQSFDVFLQTIVQDGTRLTTLGDILTHDGAAEVRLPVGLNGQQLTVVGGVVVWSTAAGSILTTLGDILVHNGTTSVRFPVGADGQFLRGNSAQPEGVEWDTFDIADIPAHASTHENGGSDEISVLGLSGLLADPQTPILHAATHENGGADEISVLGLSGLLADAQTPLAHATDHSNGGSDEITVENLGTGSATATDVLQPDGAGGLTMAALTVGSLPAHASTHENGGSDEISVLGLSGLLADPQTPLAHAAGHLPSGSDPLTTAIAVDVLTTNSIGVAESFARSDHGHRFGILTTDGDLLGFDSGNPIRFPVGANGRVLLADSAQVGGFAWTEYTLQRAYDVPATLGGRIVYSVANGQLDMDGAAFVVGATGTAGPDYMSIRRGAIHVLTTAYNATDLRTTIYSTAVNGIDLSPDPAVVPDEAIISLTPSHLEFLRQDRTFTSTAFINLFALTSVLTLDFAPSTMGAFVLFSPTIRYADTVNGFGQGLLFNASGTFENDPGVAINMTTGLSFVGQNIFRANAATITMAQVLDFLSQPRLLVTAGGVFEMLGNMRHFTARGTLGTGATLTGDRLCFVADRWSTFTGVHTGTSVGLEILDLQAGVAGASGIRSVMTAGAGRFFIEHTGSALALFGGEVEIDGDLNHDGVNVGYYGATPQPQDMGWLVSNVTTRRTLDAANPTLNDLADLVGTLVEIVMKPKGALGA